MAGKTYSAGTIFLQVVPVFGDVQRSIRREVDGVNKALGDELEKGGQEAGERASKAINKELEKGAKDGARASATEFQREFKKSVKGMADAIEPIDLRFQNNNARAQIKQIREELRELGEAEIKTDLDAKQAEAKIRVLHAQLQGLQEDAKLNAQLDVKRAVAAAAAFEKKLDSLKKAAEIEIRLERKQAERALGAFETKVRETARKAAGHLGDSMSREARRIKAELASIADADIGIDISAADAVAKINMLEQQLRSLSRKSPEIDVKIDAAKALAEIVAIRTAISALDGSSAGGKGFLRGLFSAGDGGADSAANSFRSFNAIVLAVAALLPGLIPIIGAVGGALLALVPILTSVGAGFGAMLIGFSGIGEAVQALGAQADQAGKDSNQAAKTIKAASYAVQDAKQALADAERSAAQASADAARQVADARRAAADAIEDAIERQREAQEAYRDSVQDVRQAEEDLREARKRAAEEQKAASADTKDKIRQNQLDIREAVLGAFDATNAYNSVMADGSSTAYDKEAAEVAMLQARERLHELRDTGKELAKEKRQQAKDGVNDSAEVESAEEALLAALERQRDAQEAVGEAAQNVREVRVEAARRIADAVRNQNRVEADGARSVARAQEQLRRAQEAYGQALIDTGEYGSAAMRNVEIAMGKLGPAGRKFARFIFGLRGEFYKLRDAVQSEMLPRVQRAFEQIIARYGPSFTKFMRRMGRVVGEFFLDLSKSLRGPAWTRFFGIMEKIGPRMARQFGKTTLNWLETFANVMSAVAPFAEKFSRAMLRVSDAVERWSRSKKGTSVIQGFMEYAERVGPMVIDFLSSFVRAAINLMRALAPWGEVVLKALTAVFDFIANMDPKLLGLIAGVALSLAVAFQLAVGAVALFLGGMAVFTITASTWIFAIVAAIGVIVALAIRFQWFRDVLKFVWGVISGIWKAIGKAIGWLAKHSIVKVDDIRHAWKVFVDAIKWAWNKILWPVIKAIGKIIAWLWKNIFKPYLTAIYKFWSTYFKAMVWVWKHILWPIISLIGHVIWELWKLQFKPVIDLIREHWDDLMRGMKWVWNNILKPVWDGMKEGLRVLKEVFRNRINDIKEIWDDLRGIIGRPIRFVIEEIINDGLIDGFNKIAGFVGSDKMEHVPVPKWTYATGGILPGYTPGRDPHKFVSPTGGRLELSGGEAIMRPEFTRAVGSGFINAANAAARNGGIEGVRRLLMGGGQAFARGGIFFPLPGGHMGTYPGHDGVDINVGSGSDDAGMPFYSATSGTVTSTGYSRGYGNAVFVMSPYGELVYGHSLDGSIRVHPNQKVSPGTMLAQVGSTGNSSAPHLHFGFPGGSYEAAKALLSGVPIGKPGDKGHSLPHFPGWVVDIAKNPLGYFKDLVTGPIEHLKDRFGQSEMLGQIARLPIMPLEKAAHMIWDHMPGPLKTVAGVAGKAFGALNDGLGAVGGALDAITPGDGIPGFADGGILPYNGTMMYDSGGYLPPGITNVVNLTGKPEPVFTADQFQHIRNGGGGEGGFTYAPTITEANLTSEDLADDVEFTYRKLRRRGGSKYEGAQS